MKSNLLTLLKVELMSQFRFNAFKHEKDGKKRAQTLAVGVAIFLLILMAVVYCFGLSYGFGRMGISYVVPGYALTITAIVVLCITFLKTNGVLFGGKDYDMLTALPVNTSTIITSKFLTMYIANLGFTVLIMIPMAVGYGMYNPLNAISIISWVIGILVAPLLPMTIAAIIGAIIIGIGSGFKHKVLVQTILSIVLIVGVILAPIIISKTAAQDEAAFLAQLTELGKMISSSLHRVYPLSGWFDRAVNNHEILFALLIMAVSVVVYGAFAFVVSKYYLRINSALKSHYAASNYKMKALKIRTVRTALIYKEWKRFTSSALYMMNAGIGLIMAFILSVATAFIGVDKMIGNVDTLDINVIKPIIANVIPFVIATLVNMSNTSSMSLSLEGKNLWIVDSLPIGRKTLLQGKMLFNMVLALPVSIICNIIFMFMLNVNVWMGLLYIVFAVTSVLLSTALGCFVNVRFPKYNWVNEAEVIKQSASSAIGIFSSMILYILMTMGCVFLSKTFSGELIVLGFSVLTGLAAWVVYKKI